MAPYNGVLPISASIFTIKGLNQCFVNSWVNVKIVGLSDMCPVPQSYTYKVHYVRVLFVMRIFRVPLKVHNKLIMK